MAYRSPSTGTDRFDLRSLKLDFAPEEENWREDPPPQRDVKKYILMFGLGSLSWVATYIGMLELIQANLGTLPFTHKVVIGFSVAMLMVMIIWLLDQMFKPHAGLVKFSYVGGYLFLTLISVGFGFGFYWKVLESRTEASRSAESAVGQVQSSLNGASTRLEQLQATLAQLSDVSREKSELERLKGTSCPNSRPGDGPRRKMRAADAAKFSFASEFVAGRVGAINTDMKALDSDLQKIAKKDASIVDAKSGTRNEFMRALGRKLDLTVAGFNAFRTDPQLRQMRSDLAERADKTIFKTESGGTFSCPDPQLQQALRGAVRALDQLPVLDKPTIAIVEGSEATIEAFRRLTATLQGALAFELPPSADQLRELQEKAIRQAVSRDEQEILAIESAGLSKRDYVPLAIAVFVDLCLLLVSIGRASNRIENLVPKMRAAERGPVIEILSRFKDIHRDPQVRDNFEVFRHVVFDQNGDYYVAVPLDAPYRNHTHPLGTRSYGTDEAQELQHEAHLLANLFTSFEKERIFRRVYNPLLLNTRAIQKRLARQGSKFAGCQAFRVYKFRDGAWSEIILGAVMGAARRAETKRRRAALEDELFSSVSTGIAVPQPAAPAPEPTDEPDGTIGQDPDEQSPKTAATSDILPKGLRERLNAFAPAVGPASEKRRTAKSTRSQTPHPVDAAQEAKFGPYAMHMQGEGTGFDADDGFIAEDVSEAEVTVAPPAESAVPPDAGPETLETAGPEPAAAADASPTDQDEPHIEAEPDSVPILPATRATAAAPLRVNTKVANGDRVDVVLTRDTATISVPVTEATLPNGVESLMRKALQAANAELAASDETTGVLELEADELDEDEISPAAMLTYNPDDLTDEDEAEFVEPDEVIELHDGEEVSRLASRFAARSDA